MGKTPTPEPMVTPPLPLNSPLPTAIPSPFQVGDWLTIATILLTISAAIFYFAGWVYEAYWYSFFGINLTQINIPLQQIMIEGLPGIIIIAFSSLIAIFFFNTFLGRKKDNKTGTNLVWIMVVAYGICVLFVLVIGIIYVLV